MLDQGTFMIAGSLIQVGGASLLGARCEISPWGGCGVHQDPEDASGGKISHRAAAFATSRSGCVK